MPQRERISVAEVGLIATAAFAIVGRSLSLSTLPHNIALSAALIVALLACALWRRGEALMRPGGAVFLASVVAWLIWLGARVRLAPGALAIPDWPPAVVALLGWLTMVVWLLVRAVRRDAPEPGRGFWISGAWGATAVIVLLALAMFIGMLHAGAAPAAVHLVETLNWALLYAALFTVAMHQFVGTRARRGALALAVILVLALLPIEMPG